MQRLLVFVLCALTSATAAALECPPMPQQTQKDVDVEIKAAVAKIGPVKGGELETKTRVATQDLLGKLPQADRLYLEQMMLATFCSGLRDDKTLSEREKARRIAAYSAEVRKALRPQTSQPPAPASRPPRSSTDAPRMSVTLATDLDAEKPQSSYPGEHDASTTVQYRYESGSKGMIVAGSLPYFEALSRGDIVPGLKYGHEPFAWSFPTLSFKLVNNSGPPLLLSEIVIDVKRSRVNDEPVPLLRQPAFEGKVWLLNVGWGPMRDVRAALGFEPIERCRESSFHTRDARELRAPEIDRYAPFDVNPFVPRELRQATLVCPAEATLACAGRICARPENEAIRCADPSPDTVCHKIEGTLPDEFIAKLLTSANRSQNSTERPLVRGDIRYERMCDGKPICVFAELRYLGSSNTQRAARFIASVSLGMPYGGAPAPPTHTYGVLLEAGREGYVSRVPISQLVKAGEADHFGLRIGTDKSAEFDLVLDVLDSNGKKISSTPIHLAILIPRTLQDNIKPLE